MCGLRNMANFSGERVDPDALRFTQDSIAEYVRYKGKDVRLEENLKLLKSGQLHPDDFPPLEVYRDEDGVVWSNDNRRLWLFRKAGISEIEVKVYTEPLRRAPPEMKEDRDSMSRPDYFPYVRRKWEPANPDASRIWVPRKSEAADVVASRISQASPSGEELRAPQSVHTCPPNTTKSADLMNMASRMVNVDPDASRISQASPSGEEFTQTIRGQSPEKRSPPTSNRKSKSTDNSQALVLGAAAAVGASALFMGCSTKSSLLVGFASWMILKISGA